MPETKDEYTDEDVRAWRTGMTLEQLAARRTGNREAARQEAAKTGGLVKDWVRSYLKINFCISDKNASDIAEHLATTASDDSYHDRVDTYSDTELRLVARIVVLAVIPLVESTGKHKLTTWRLNNL